MPRTKTKSAKTVQSHPYLVLSVATRNAIDKTDLTLLTHSQILHEAVTIDTDRWPPKVVVNDTINQASKSGKGYRRTVTDNAYACKLPDFHDHPFYCILPNYDSIGGQGSHCLIPPSHPAYSEP